MKKMISILLCFAGSTMLSGMNVVSKAQPGMNVRKASVQTTSGMNVVAKAQPKHVSESPVVRTLWVRFGKHMNNKFAEWKKIKNPTPIEQTVFKQAIKAEETWFKGKINELENHLKAIKQNQIKINNLISARNNANLKLKSLEAQRADKRNWILWPSLTASILAIQTVQNARNTSIQNGRIKNQKHQLSARLIEIELNKFLKNSGV